MVAEFTPSFVDYDKLPPQNIELEEAILGGILLDRNALARIVDILSDDAFSLTQHRTIYRAACALHKQGKPPDLMAVTTWLSDRNQLEKVGGMSKLAQLVDRTVSAVNIDQYAASVMDKFIRRSFISLGHEFIRHGYESIGDLCSLFEWAGERLNQISFLSPGNKDDLDTLKYHKCIESVRAIEVSTTDPGLKAWKMKHLATKYDCSPRQLEEIYYRSLLAEDDEPMMSWEAAIDKHGSATREWRMHGWLPKGKLIIEHGDGGSGKTRLSYNFLYHIATGQDWDGFPVKQGRSIVIQTDEAPSDMLQVLEDRGLAHNPLIRYKTRWNIDFLQGLIQEIEEFKPAFILIDSLTSINKRSIFSENDVEYARPLLLLKDVAQKYGVTIIVIHHSSREGNARGSTAIRNSASEVWRLKVDNSQSADGSHRILDIEKSRSRKLASYLLRYNEDDGSWTCLGKSGSENHEGGIGGSIKERVVKFLRRSPGVFYHPEEIQSEIGGGIDSVRRSCGELANEGIISRKGRRPALYGINFGDTGGDSPDVPPGLSVLGTPRILDTTDQSTHVAIAQRSLERSLVESSSDEASSEFRSSDRENTVFFASGDGEKNMRSSDRLISRNNCDTEEDSESACSNNPSESLSNTKPRSDTTDQSVQKSDRSLGAVTEVNNGADDESLAKDGLGQVLAVGDRVINLTGKQMEGTVLELCEKYALVKWDGAVASCGAQWGYSRLRKVGSVPTDGLGQVLTVGDHVATPGIKGRFGELIELNPQLIGSPKEPSTQWKATVRWYCCGEQPLTSGITTESTELLQAGFGKQPTDDLGQEVNNDRDDHPQAITTLNHTFKYRAAGDGDGLVGYLGCSHQKLAKEWAKAIEDLGGRATVIRSKWFAVPGIKWDVEIRGLELDRLQKIAQMHPEVDCPVPQPKRRGSK
jgi:archaellum biogenesis ATPase FlaH